MRYCLKFFRSKVEVKGEGGILKGPCAQIDREELSVIIHLYSFFCFFIFIFSSAIVNETRVKGVTTERVNGQNGSRLVHIVFLFASVLFGRVFGFIIGGSTERRRADWKRVIT